MPALRPHARSRAMPRRGFASVGRVAARAILSAVVLAACEEPAGPAVGDVYFLDASAQEVYDCAPGSAEAIDQTICGSRVDTVDTDYHGRLAGRLGITRIDTVEDRRRAANGVAPGGAGPEALTLEGEVTERVCAPACATTIAIRRAFLQRWQTACLMTAACHGEVADTVVAVVVQIEGMHGIFGFTLGGIERELGRVEGDYLQFGQLVPMIPPSRHGTRYHLSLQRERHYLGRAAG
jgi:hypothetical protein